ncbi:MAG: hypothetical protein V5A17_14035, partial [Natronomonas sp.]
MTKDQPSTNGRYRAITISYRISRLAIIILLALALTTAQPAVAQTENPVCEEESGTLTDMIEGFVQLTTGLGI